MLINGMKKTVLVGAPLAIVADVDVMRKAPYDMTTSGFGDLLGKLNSKIDWKVANLLTGEYYCEYIAELVDETVRSCAEQAAAIRTQSTEAIATLAEGLILSGMGMIAVGNSRPASGAEHHIAHFWEIKALTDNRPEHFHGTKVGVGTALIAKFYEKLATRNPFDIDLGEIKRRKPSYEEWESQIRRVFGRVADAIIAMKKPHFLDWESQKAVIKKIQASWDQFKALQAQEPTYDEVAAYMETVGGPYLPKDVHVDRDFLRETLLYCKEVRSQYTVLSVAEVMGWLEEIVEEVVQEFD
jgi:glycerol-1-phosphate dehydrogenase [NAD(P)+]